MEKFKLHDLVVFTELSFMLTSEYVIVEIDDNQAKVAKLELTGQLEGNFGPFELSFLSKPKEISISKRAAYAVYKQNVIKQEDELIELNDEAKKRRRIIKAIAKDVVKPNVLHKMLKDLDAAGVIKYFA
jgi:hypothetical protein